MQKERPFRDAPRGGAPGSDPHGEAPCRNKGHLVGLVKLCWNNRYPLESVRRHVALDSVEASLRPEAVRADLGAPRQVATRHKLSQRLTTAQKIQIVEYYRDGHSSRDTGRQFGISKTTVIRLTRELGATPRTPHVIRIAV